MVGFFSSRFLSFAHSRDQKPSCVSVAPPSTVPDACAVSFAFVTAAVPLTDPAQPLAAALSFALLYATVPVTVVVPLALLVSFAFVVALVPVTGFPTVPLAVAVSLALVVADVPVTAPSAGFPAHVSTAHGEDAQVIYRPNAARITLR